MTKVLETVTFFVQLRTICVFFCFLFFFYDFYDFFWLIFNFVVFFAYPIADTVIGECVDQIDMLTSELDRYCTLSYRALVRQTPTASCTRGPTAGASSVEPYCTLPRNYRSPMARGDANNGTFFLDVGREGTFFEPAWMHDGFCTIFLFQVEIHHNRNLFLELY